MQNSLPLCDPVRSASLSIASGAVGTFTFAQGGNVIYVTTTGSGVLVRVRTDGVDPQNDSNDGPGACAVIDQDAPLGPFKISGDTSEVRVRNLGGSTATVAVTVMRTN